MLRGFAAIVAAVCAITIGLIAALLATGALATALIANRIEAHDPPIGRFVEVRGGRLSVIEAGPERNARGTVVLLHGASANASDPMEGFGRQIAAKGFRVLSFDRPGFGWSDRLGGAEAGSPAFQSAVIGEALDTLGVGPAIVYGHSWAGALALRMALDRPDRVSGLVLAAPVALPFADTPLPWWANFALEPRLTRFLTETIAVPLGLYYLPSAALGVFKPEAMAEGYVERSRAALILRPGPALANIQDLVDLPTALKSQAPRYPSLRLPTTIVAGEADQVVTAQLEAVRLAQAIPDAKLVLLPGVGHMLHVTAPGAIVTEIEAMQSRLAEPASR